jgi:hypothetical protein
MILSDDGELAGLALAPFARVEEIKHTFVLAWRCVGRR